MLWQQHPGSAALEGISLLPALLVAAPGFLLAQLCVGPCGSHITELEVDQGPETLQSALLLQPGDCATAPGLQLRGGSQLTSLQAAVERSSPAPICAPGLGAQRGTLQRDEGISPAISAPAGNYLAFLLFFFSFPIKSSSLNWPHAWLPQC